MKTDTSQIKPRLREYLQKKGITIGNGDKLRCPNPDHQDKKPSAQLYENTSGDHVVTCMTQCDKSWDIFELSKMLDNARDFPEQLKAVQETLNITELPTTTTKKTPKEKTTRKGNTNYVTLDREAAKKIYIEKSVKKIADFIYKKRELTFTIPDYGKWPYIDKDGKIACMDIRLDLSDGDKNVITFWYNGKNLKAKEPPHLIYNLHEILQNPDKPILISEGCKAAEASRPLSIFTPCTWNGGTNRASYVDWSPLADRDVFIYYDDDQKIVKTTGILKPLNQQPGYKAAMDIKKQLPNAHIITPYPEARKIKPDGADIEEALQVATPEELTKYILSCSEAVPQPAPLNTPPTHSTHASGAASGDDNVDNIPYKILGVADDAHMYFLDEVGRLQNFKPTAINKPALLTLAPLEFWKEDYGFDGKVSWDKAISDVLYLSRRLDFNLESVRGRGAWRERDGRICYHDGQKTIGEPDSKRVYVKKRLIDIGLSDKPLDMATRGKIKDAIFKMSFETKVDAVRALAWATLAPFAGALKVRPSLLCTGESQSGKSTLVTEVINPMSVGKYCNGETTPAAIKGMADKDSYPFCVDEAEGDIKASKYGNDNRTELFKLMRISYSDDSPDTGKGTKDGGFRSSKMVNMFLFNAIDPGIENPQDENRIFRINMIKHKAKNEWKELEKEIKSLMSEKNCRALRSLVWSKIKYIFELADRMTEFIIDETSKGYRSCYAEGLMCAAYIAIWSGNENPSDKKITEFLKDFYSLQPPEESRNDAEELLNRLLNEVIEIIHSGRREKITIYEGLKRVKTGIILPMDDVEGDKGVGRDTIRDTINEIARYGIKITGEHGDIAIDNKDHHMIMRIIRRGKGYKKIFKRHPGLVSSSKLVTFPDKQRHCTVIGGIVKTDDEMSVDEALEGVM